MTFKVANIISAFKSKSGGPPRTVALIAAAGLGTWSTELFTTSFQESPADTLLIDDYPGPVNVLPDQCHGMLGGLAMWAGFNRSFRTQLRRGAPHLIHIHGMWDPYLAAFADEARRLEVPYIVAPHGMLEPWSMSVRSVRKMLALKSYQGTLLTHAAAIHATSELEADNLRRLINARTPVFIVPNCVEPPPSAVTKPSPPRGEKKVLLFLSRIHEKKGLDILLRAWNDLRPADWRLLIVGSGEAEYLAQLARFCASNAVPDVEFKSHVEGAEREDVFARASAFVLPTYSENFGNVIAEALIRGLPVITTTGTPWSDIVAHECGWYIEPTLDELRTTLAAVVATDPQTLQRMGERGRKYATDHFSLSVVRRALLQMYQSVMPSSPNRYASFEGLQ